MIIGHIKHVCYTAELHSLTAERAVGILHRHVTGSEDRQRPFNVLVKDGVFRCTTISSSSGSISEHFHVKKMVPFQKM